MGGRQRLGFPLTDVLLLPLPSGALGLVPTLDLLLH